MGSDKAELGGFGGMVCREGVGGSGEVKGNEEIAGIGAGRWRGGVEMGLWWCWWRAHRPRSS